MILFTNYPKFGYFNGLQMAKCISTKLAEAKDEKKDRNFIIDIKHLKEDL